MIKYYESLLTPGCYYVALDDVMVAFWDDRSGCSNGGRWCDNGLYRSHDLVGKNVKTIEWNRLPYDPSFLAMPEEYQKIKKP